MSSTTPIISAENISLQLGRRKILDHVTFSIEAGEFIAILGPNGAGKTTLLKLLLGLLRPTAGEISVLGEQPRRGNAHIGYAPQHRVLESDLALRARDVVGFGYDGNQWGISLFDRKKESALHTILTEVDALQLSEKPMHELSGGEQQRLLIAQALITRPKILLLDEPLANLDIHHTQEIVSLLKKICHEKNVTVLLVSHDVNPLLPVADRVLYMANGHATLGTADEVITNKTLSQLYGSPVEVAHVSNRVFVLGAET